MSSLQQEGGENSNILDAMMKMDRELEDERRAGVDSDSEREVYSSSNDTGASPSTDLSTSRGTGVGREDDSTAAMSIAHAENKAVMFWKIVVVLVLVASTVGVATAVFLYVSGEEQAEFEAAFADDSLKVFEAVGNALDVKLAAVDAFVASVISYANATNKTWPFVTLPDFLTPCPSLNSKLFGMTMTGTCGSKITWDKTMNGFRKGSTFSAKIQAFRGTSLLQIMKGME